MKNCHSSIDESKLVFINRGGEGEIYAVDSKTVLKLYHENKNPDAEKQRKLEYLASLKIKALHKYASLPFQLIKYKNRYGYLMPRVPGSYKPLHEMFGAASFKENFPQADYRLRIVTALNIAKVIKLLHTENIIIGDINQNGVLVNAQGDVRFIDTDSYQLTDKNKIYKCDVGSPEYTPPELQGQSFKNVIRTKEHDCFGLAVLIFQLLFLGRNPFAGAPVNPQE